MFEKFTEKARRVMFFARYEASQFGSESIQSGHLLLGLLRESEKTSTQLLERMGVQTSTLRERLVAALTPKDRKITPSSTSIDIPMEEEVKHILQHATAESAKLNHKHVGAEHLLLGMLKEEGCLAGRLLKEAGADLIAAKEILLESSKEEKIAKKKKEHPLLSEFARNLSEMAERGIFDNLIGRDQEVNRIIQILSRRRKNNPILLGEAGVGKTAIVEGLAQKIHEGMVPPSLADKRIYALDLSLVVAGTKYRGQFEERLKSIIAEASKDTSVVLFIDEIHSLIGTGAAEGSLDAANILKPALVSGKLRCIGSTTYDEYRKYFEKDGALSRRFQKVEVPEPTVEETVRILEGLRERYETYHQVAYTEEGLRAAAELSHRYISDRRLPDKAIDVIDEAGAFSSMNRGETDAAADAAAIGAQEIERVVARIARIPEKSVSSTEVEKLRDLKTALQARIFGQGEAVDRVVEAVNRSRAGFREPDKPVASLLFVGPTGVGKTELARQLAATLGVPLLRYDMSEYQEKHAVAKFVGAPPGYVGYEEGGLLTEAIRKNPHAVLLLDEIEKAHADIFNALLQVMDYATLTDNNGKKADFRNVILLMTSNAGAREIGRQTIGFEGQPIQRDAVYKALERAFSPEFRNRLDGVVNFLGLTEEVVRKIVKRNVAEFAAQLLAKKVLLTVTDGCYDWLARKGYSPEFGAREIARLVQDKVKRFFVDEVLFGSLHAGGDAVADIENDDVVVRVTHAGLPTP